MKEIDQFIPDLQIECDKITKSFNTIVAKEFYKELEESAKDWYYNNKSSGIYKRTKQLRDNAVLKEKENEYEFKVSFSPQKIIRKSWETPDKPSSNWNKNTVLGSYEDVHGNDVASQVLAWEEEGVGVFSKYNYKKGSGIWGKALDRFIKKIDTLTITNPKLNMPDDIKKDLIELMKKKSKQQLQKEYDEDFG